MQAILLNFDPHLKTKVDLGAVEVTKDSLPCQILCRVWESADGVIVVDVVICDEPVDLAQLHE